MLALLPSPWLQPCWLAVCLMSSLGSQGASVAFAGFSVWGCVPCSQEGGTVRFSLGRCVPPEPAGRARWPGRGLAEPCWLHQLLSHWTLMCMES